jgi:hypothetical protein
LAVNAAAKADKSQERFYDALRELFVGAKVEGQSGFINLMRIKSRYYTDGVFPRLQKDIDQAHKPFPGLQAGTVRQALRLLPPLLQPQRLNLLPAHPGPQEHLREGLH